MSEDGKTEDTDVSGVLTFMTHLTILTFGFFPYCRFCNFYTRFIIFPIFISNAKRSRFIYLTISYFLRSGTRYQWLLERKACDGTRRLFSCL